MVTKLERPEAKIHLVGDSFVQKLSPSQSGLHAHLTRELGAPVHAFYRFGTGGRILQEWIDAHDLSKPQIVIVAIAEKYACFETLWRPIREPLAPAE